MRTTPRPSGQALRVHRVGAEGEPLRRVAWSVQCAAHGRHVQGGVHAAMLGTVWRRVRQCDGLGRRDGAGGRPQSRGGGAIFFDRIDCVKGLHAPQSSCGLPGVQSEGTGQGWGVLGIRRERTRRLEERGMSCEKMHGGVTSWRVDGNNSQELKTAEDRRGWGKESRISGSEQKVRAANKVVVV